MSTKQSPETGNNTSQQGEPKALVGKEWQVGGEREGDSDREVTKRGALSQQAGEVKMSPGVTRGSLFYLSSF